MLDNFNWYSVFLKVCSAWLILLVSVNLVSMMIFAADKDDLNWGFLYASIVANVVVSYLVGIFMWLNRDALSVFGLVDSNDPFHEWIWFSAPAIEKWATTLCFLAWLVPNLMHLFYLQGFLSWVVGIFFIISMIWWFIVGVLVCRSFFQREDSLLLPR